MTVELTGGKDPLPPSSRTATVPISPDEVTQLIIELATDGYDTSRTEAIADKLAEAALTNPDTENTPEYQNIAGQIVRQTVMLWMAKDHKLIVAILPFFLQQCCLNRDFVWPIYIDDLDDTG